MPLAFQLGGLLGAGLAVKNCFLPGVKIGLFSANVYPDVSTTLKSLRPCRFSGYPGLLAPGAWFGPTVVGTKVELTTTPIPYYHNGGPVGETVIGYYFVSSTGQLIWAERLPDGPAVMASNEQALVVTPSISLSSQFTGGNTVATLYGQQPLDLDVAADAVAGSLDALAIDLVKINGPFGRNPDTAALVAGIADFTGYAEGVVTWEPPSLDDAGEVEVVGTCPAFRATGTTVTNQVYGVIVRNTAKTKMYFNGPIDGAPIDFLSALDQLIVTLRWKPATQALTVSIA